jgi:hypothetical protein
MARILSSQQLSVQTGRARLHFGLPTTGLYSYAQRKGHRDTVQPRSISVRYDINDVEPLSGKELLHQWNRPKSHNLGTTIGPNGLKSIMKKVTSDTLPVEVTANHTPRECRHLFGIHGPTATRNDYPPILDDKVWARKVVEKTREIVSILRHEELRRISVENLQT